MIQPAMRALLARSAMFGGLEPAVLDDLAAHARMVGFAPDEPLFHAGDAADGLYCIASGLVRIHLVHIDGRELTLNLLEAGDVIGEIALLDGLARTADATAIEPTQTLFLDRRHFAAMLDRSPQIARHVIYVLCERLRRNTEQLERSAFLGLRARLMQLLRELALSHGGLKADAGEIALRLTQTDLARMLAVTREAVNKQLRAMVKEGAVEIDDGRIVIRRFDPEVDQSRHATK
jgi:CRP-like cAMP-binding protein